MEAAPAANGPRPSCRAKQARLRMFCTPYPAIPRDIQARAEEVISTAKRSKIPPPYIRDTRGRDTTISPADMGRTKNRLVWTVWRMVS